MEQIVKIGIQNFEDVITEDVFYIDKTQFIKEWWESGDSVTLITRPHGFGKTLNISMLEYFFSVKHADKKYLFEGLFIWKEEKYREIQGTYPVIKVSFAHIKSTNYESVKQEINHLLMELYKENYFLLKNNFLSEFQKPYFHSVQMNMSEVEAASVINKLCNLLSQYYGKKVIVLIDDFDIPMKVAYVHGYWKELIPYIRSIFNCTFKDNPYLFRGMMIGSSNVGMELICSDLNMNIITTTSDKYARVFGFTEEEVEPIFVECGLRGERNDIKKFYGGYILGNNIQLYNPSSLLNFLKNGNYEIYWRSTSTDCLVEKLVREGNKNIKTAFEVLLKGESLECAIEERWVNDYLIDNEEAVWSLFLSSGYLKVLRYEKVEVLDYIKEPVYELAFTNKEVLYLFYDMVKGWFKDMGEDYDGFIDAMLYGDIAAMNVYMNRVISNTFRYFDTENVEGEGSPERFYHGLVLGLITELHEAYLITSNCESGFGKYDIILEPNDKTKDALILEFKVHDQKKEVDLKETTIAALQQIEEKQYEASLIAKGFSAERIRKYAFAFEGQKLLIE